MELGRWRGEIWAGWSPIESPNSVDLKWSLIVPKVILSDQFRIQNWSSSVYKTDPKTKQFQENPKSLQSPHKSLLNNLNDLPNEKR